MSIIQKQAASIPKALRAALPQMARQLGVPVKRLTGGLTVKQSRYLNHILSVANGGKISSGWVDREQQVGGGLRELKKLLDSGAVQDAQQSIDWRLPPELTFSDISQALSGKPIKGGLEFFTEPEVKLAARKLPFSAYRKGFRFPKLQKAREGISFIDAAGDSSNNTLFRSDPTLRFRRAKLAGNGGVYYTPNIKVGLGYRNNPMSPFEVLRVPEQLMGPVREATTPHVAGRLGRTIEEVIKNKQNIKVTDLYDPTNPDLTHAYEVVLPRDYRDMLLRNGAKSKLYTARPRGYITGFHDTWHYGDPWPDIAYNTSLIPYGQHIMHGQYPIKIK